MTVSNIGPVAPGTINYGGALTPDALMAYCESRLRGLDDQMHDAFARQETFRTASAALNDVQKTLQDAANGNGFDPNDGDGPWKVMQGFDTAIKNMPPGRDRDELIKQANDFKSHCKQADDYNNPANPSGKKWVYDGPLLGQPNGKQACSDLAEHIGDINKNASSSAELDMISLQSLMSQRQTAVQMCTNMVSALGETSKAIAQKIGS